MYGIQKSTLDVMQNGFQADTTAYSPDPDPTDPWLFTDPIARAYYEQNELAGKLREDIQTYAMSEGYWTPDELDYKLEIRRLLQEGMIVSWNSFGYMSPHPTIYRTKREGTLEVSGRRYTFRDFEGLAFTPWLARYIHPSLIGPLEIGQLSLVSNPCLCCEAFPLLCIHCDKTRAIMRQILNYRNKRK